jgi:hypothetical protein
MLESHMEFAMDIVELEDFTVVLWLHTSTDPPQQEWDVAIQRLEDHIRDHHVGLHRVRGLVISDGASPNARQRASLRAPMAKGKSAVITTVLTNSVKRGIATALMWMFPSLAFFEPRQTEAALKHVDLDGQLHVLWKHFAALQQRLPPNATLELVAQACGLVPVSRVATNAKGSE